MLGFVLVQPSSNTQTSENFLSFSFQSFSYNLQSLQTSQRSLDDPSKEKISELLKKLNSKIGKERKALVKLNCLVYLTLLLFLVIMGVILNSFQIQNGGLIKTTAKSTESTNESSQEAKLPVITILLVFAFIFGFVFIYWYKYKIGKKIVYRIAPVMDQYKADLRNLGLEISIHNDGYFPLCIDLVPLNFFTPQEAFEKLEYVGRNDSMLQVPENENLVNELDVSQDLGKMNSQKEIELIRGEKGSQVLDSVSEIVEIPPSNEDPVTFRA